MFRNSICSIVLFLMFFTNSYGMEFESNYDLECSYEQPNSCILQTCKKHSPLNNYKNNPYISAEACREISPYILPYNHPLRPNLDLIFSFSRATLNNDTFSFAGFETLFSQPRSFIQVARHPLLPGYLIKVVLDSELRIKMCTPDWKWFVKRCEAAEVIRNIIKKKKIKNFVMAEKFLYPLPRDPSPPNDPAYTRKILILVAKDMQLCPKEENLNAWKNLITKEHLDELLKILSNAPGMTVRADNIAYTVNGVFAFIDTEYTRNRPNYSAITPYLSEEMQEYWRAIVKKHKGGKS